MCALNIRPASHRLPAGGSAKPKIHRVPAVSSVREGLPLPDLLHAEAHLGIDFEALQEILGMAALGRELGTQLHDALARSTVQGSTWDPEFFADELFVESLVQACFTLELEGRTYPVNQRFLHRTLVHTPTDLETITFRQAILRELEEKPTLLANLKGLYRSVFDLMSLHKAPGYQATLDVAAFHLDLLKQTRKVIDQMHDGFAEAESGLQRLHQAARDIRGGREYQTLARLLQYEQGMAEMTVDLRIGGDGRIRDLMIRDLREDEKNPFHVKPLRRFFSRLKLAFRGYPISNRELMNNLINEVFSSLSPYFVPLVQLLGHLEFYLTARTFRSRAHALGLDVCLPSFDRSTPLGLDDLFNPLLLVQSATPVPTRIHSASPSQVTLITGPNSGGKTRLLQALALTQMLGQSGIYAPCSRAMLRVESGLFVSLIEDESAEQTEGRLGRELMRIRSLFERMATGSMVILDELCSGTNPSEGVEVFSMVLQLLQRVQPRAFVTTHFLDFARNLADQPIIEDLEFLQVQIDDQMVSTYQFEEGVAETSLAALTAQRLGVTFERLSSMVRDGVPESDSEPEA
ncbi:MAG: DNA mismatch repair protein [Acidobacteriota bacterium]